MCLKRGPTPTTGRTRNLLGAPSPPGETRPAPTDADVLHPVPPAGITLFIRGFGVQVPGGAPRGLHVSCRPIFTFASDISVGTAVLPGPGCSEGAGGALLLFRP